MALNAKQKRFVAEYLLDLNATQAAIRAGYSARTANQQGPRLLVNAGIAAAIQEAQQKLAEKVAVSAEDVLMELARLGFSNMMDYVTPQPDGSVFLDFSKLTREQAAAIQEVTVEEFTDGRGEGVRQVRRTKFKLAPKQGALELLGKHLAMWIDRKEIGKPGDFQHLTDDELRERVLAVARRVYRVPDGGAGRGAAGEDESSPPVPSVH